jgi:hypothetical protein
VDREEHILWGKEEVEGMEGERREREREKVSE